jgi:catechol 2,3-dioxygenase-like lactoylglutathione lyase family enzyme
MYAVMTTRILGLHHVTAIVGDPQENVDFYAGLLGLRLVKTTVNFDDPHTYHLYFGDELGHPGTLITFFPWPTGRHGARGTGQISAFAFAVPAGALGYWQERLAAAGVRFGGPEQRFDTPTLSFYDPAGLLVELVERPGIGAEHAWSGSTVPDAYAIRALAGVTLTVPRHAPTAELLTETLGFQKIGSAGSVERYEVGEGAARAIVDIVGRPDVPHGRFGVGTIHHVAWRVADDASELQAREELIARGHEVTPVRDRSYFKSIYFVEPGGVIFELATDGPGFAIDESPEELGTHLKLPPWLEERRAEIEAALLPLRRQVEIGD